ncbi:hypothetical protein OQA88_4284 [Cercophora sp. LCS_1]
MASESNPASNTPTLKTACHCGRVEVEIPSKPDKLNQCHCTVCYKYGCLWGYFKASEVKVTIAEGAHLEKYVRSDEGGRGNISFDRCNHCGCVVTWSKPNEQTVPNGKKGVNCRMLPLDVVEGIPKEVTTC